MNDNMPRRTLMIATAGAALAVALAACSGHPSSSNDPGSSTTAHSSAPAASAPAATPSSSPATSSATTASSLDGTWSGQYSGAFSGTFTLTWQQSGSHLKGTIHISNPDQTMPINGTVNGGQIQFGTVGSTAITYSGTISGSSMAGNYQVGVQGSSSAGGPWSASKS
jgi:heat shock protein HslJ